MLALLLWLVPAVPQEPPVQVQLSHDQLSRGERARVYVETVQDGYLVVLHADPDGRIRVLFPLDPSDDDFVRGGQRQELVGRSGRAAFLVDADDGSGTVLAAVSRDPFTYDRFVRNDHWDYRALVAPGGQAMGDDPLAGLLDIVRGMAGEAPFEYDAATYVAGTPRGVASHYGSGSGYGIGLSFGFPYRYRYFYDPFYDPFCFDPYWGWGSACPRYGFGLGFGYSWYRPRVYGYGGTVFLSGENGGLSGRGGSRLVIPRDRARYTPDRPRSRAGLSDPASVRDRRTPSRAVAPRPRSGARPSVAPRGGGSGVSRERPRPSGGRPSVSRGSGSGSRPAARPSSGGGGRRSSGSAAKGRSGGGRRP